MSKFWDYSWLVTRGLVLLAFEAVMAASMAASGVYVFFSAYTVTNNVLLAMVITVWPVVTMWAAQRYFGPLVRAKVVPEFAVAMELEKKAKELKSEIVFDSDASNETEYQKWADETNGFLANQFGSGKANPKAVLNESQVLEIRKDPRSYAAIAGEYGVSVTQIGRIKRRERWGSVK